MELTKSAELLAKSERESAWREMAKQVAHEIKNPLTPMKLSVQHLQRMWNDKDPEIEQKLQRITNTLIEQIDTLSSIASAFSSFAKMPKPTSEKVDLDAVLQNTISLFKEIDGTTINYTNHLSEKAFVFADKEQLLRVFNNLVKNALQCIPESRRGQITVSLNAGDIGYTVTVNDNGSGISKEVAEKIFTPNFTTKSTGMGLGLVMAKNIVENFDGKIWFTTEEEKGSAFYVELPKYNSV
ncbi:MAG: GHKL domain-containing protein [Bacteroidia bacterium]|nr:GHKL domain-containing protein [Bacteroidia bacterium]